jgi:RNA polymerase sigma factor (sigma-70 family)
VDDIVHIRKCLEGCSEAFEDLVVKYRNLVYGIALNVLNNKNEAADVTQEVFLKAWANLGRYDPQYSFKSWIARITVNHSINVNNKSRNQAQILWDDEEIGRISADRGIPEEEMLAAEKRDAVRKAVESLPEMYRLVVTLFHQQSFSYEEICRITGYPLSIVKNRLYRARKMLCEMLSQYSKEGPEGRKTHGLQKSVESDDAEDGRMHKGIRYRKARQSHGGLRLL